MRPSDLRPSDFKNTVRDFCRSKSFRKKKQEQEIDETLAAFEDNNELDQIIESEWHLHLTSCAWKSLESRFTDKTREAFMMGLKGVPYREIANKLSISPGSVQVYKNRIEKFLIKEIRRLNNFLY